MCIYGEVWLYKTFPIRSAAQQLVSIFVPLRARDPVTTRVLVGSGRHDVRNHRAQRQRRRGPRSFKSSMRMECLVCAVRLFNGEISTTGKASGLETAEASTGS